MESELQHNRLCETSRLETSHHREQASYTAAEHQHQRIQENSHECRFMITLNRSLELRIPITIRMYDVFEKLLVIGIVEDIDWQQGRFRVDGEWFMLGDIVEIVEIEQS